MEFFLPGLLLFIVAILVVFFLVPKATPMIAAVFAIVFLVYGVYDHQRLFASEYHLSTWQDQLKIYSPALMIIAIILFIMYSMLSFFTSGFVPIPTLPSITLPSIGSITNSITESVNNAAKSVQNVSINLLSNNTSTRNNRNNKSNVSKSFVETI